MSSTNYDSLKKKYAYLIPNITYKSAFDRTCLDTSYHYYISKSGKKSSARVSLGIGSSYSEATFLMRLNENKTPATNSSVRLTNEKILAEFNDTKSGTGFVDVKQNFDKLIAIMKDYIVKFKHSYYFNGYPNNTHYFSINSSYRTPTHNASVGDSSTTSDHMRGLAVDISFRQLAADEMINILLDNNIIPGYSSKKASDNKINQFIVYFGSAITATLTASYPELVKAIRNKNESEVRKWFKVLLEKNTSGNSKIQDMCLRLGLFQPVNFIHFGCNSSGTDHQISYNMKGGGKATVLPTKEEYTENLEIMFDREYYYNEILK